MYFVIFPAGGPKCGGLWSCRFSLVPEDLYICILLVVTNCGALCTSCYHCGVYASVTICKKKNGHAGLLFLFGWMDGSSNPAKTGVTVLVSPGCAQVALDSLSCEKCIGHQVIIRSCLSYIFYPRYHNYIYAKHWCFDLQVKMSW